MNLAAIDELLDEIANDRTVPRNVRTLIQQAREDLANEKLDAAVKLNSAISVLDDVANDPNIPSYTRTQIWNIVSLLETKAKA